MPDIYEYTDYRLFLRDYYNEKKAKDKNFTYETFSQKVGIKSRGFIHNVIRGLRNVSSSNVFRLSRAMRLSHDESDYFENLVAFNQARSLRERNYLYEKITSVKGRKGKEWKPREVRENQFEFYSKFHHSIIRSLIDMYSFKDDYNWLAKKVNPRMAPKEAKKSVKLLEKLGLIRKQKNGTYKVMDKCIATPKEIASLALLNFHKETAKLALNAISEFPNDKRNFQGLTLGITEKTYKKICEEVHEFRTRLMRIAEEDKEANAVYRLNFQFFSVSDIKNERSKK